MRTLADVYSWFIRFLHILSGVMWVGGIFMWSMLIAPTVQRRLPPQVAGPFMGVIVPRLSRYLSLAGVVTVVTGLWTMGLITGFGSVVPVFQNQSWGRVLGAALVLALGMLGVAFGLIIPAANRLLAIMANAPKPAPGTPPGPPPPEVPRLQKRLMMGGMINLVLGTIALGLMAWAANVGAA